MKIVIGINHMIHSGPNLITFVENSPRIIKENCRFEVSDGKKACESKG
jgi:hypothetical protein